MKLRVFSKSYNSGLMTSNYYDYTCETFEVTEALLVIKLESGKEQYVPLLNVQSFKLLENEDEAT
jgi:hypothetical protein